MSMTLTLIDLAGAIALLLWGVHMVQSGIQRAFGPQLRRFLGRTLHDRFSAFLAGLGVTAVLQSSTATGLMTASFAAGGLVDLVPALAVMLGANVGTTLIVQLLSFSIAHVAPRRCSCWSALSCSGAARPPARATSAAWRSASG
jgi:phosphate:Na+ symporter